MKKSYIPSMRFHIVAQKGWKYVPKSLLLLLIVLFAVAFRPLLQDKKLFEAYEEPLEGSGEAISLVPVKGGRFLMGADGGAKAEAPAHEVVVGDFWMGVYEITWDQYLQFSEERNNQLNPQRGNEVNLEVDAIASATTPYVDMSHGMGKKAYPVSNVTQHAALAFCQWLSAKTGRFYRLPTEAEWEYACRAGSREPYSFGSDTTLLGTYAWYDGNSEKRYHKVGQKKPNAFGLYDMHGNVAEWTMDAYREDTYANREGAPEKDPWVVPEQLYPRTVRGGSWQDKATALRSSARTASDARWKRIDPQIPKSRWWFTNAPHVGFRIVRPRNTPSPEAIKEYWLEAIEDY